MHRKSTFFPLIALTLLLALVSLLLLGRGQVARAQDAAATPAATDVVTDTAEVAATEESTETVEMATEEVVETLEAMPKAYVTLDLDAGLTLDPWFVSVNGGGGTIDAATIADGCVGFVREEPVVTLNWAGDAELLRIFFHSDHDSSMVVQLPDESYQCADDAEEYLIDAQVQIDAPAPGEYRIWVGNEEHESRIPGVLVLSERESVDVGSFELDSLIQRPALPVDDGGEADTDAVEPATKDTTDADEEVGDNAVNEFVEELPEVAEVRAGLAALLAATTNVPALEEGSTLTATTVLTGMLPGFVWPVHEGSPQPLCSGVSDDTPALYFSVEEGLPLLRVFVESELDSTLLLLSPEGDFYCTDESPDGLNRNPLIDVEAPMAGTWAVVVGRLTPAESAEAAITVTTDDTLQPAQLDPVAPAQN